MIRRPEGNDWLLLSQVEHARLAGRIADVWGNAVVSNLPLPELLVPAVRHHDDGWYEYEQALQLDSETGTPRSFTEMPMDVATGIWSRSIEFCLQGEFSHSVALRRLERSLASEGVPLTPGHVQELDAVLQFRLPFTSRQFALALNESSATDSLDRLERADVIVRASENDQMQFRVAVPSIGQSYLGALWVSQHFCDLARKARESRQDIPAEVAACDGFLAGQSKLQEEWRNHVGDVLEPDQSRVIIESGFRFVQFFDRLSLWLCMEPRTDAFRLDVPYDHELRVIPQEERIALSPWPLAVDRLELAVQAKRIPAGSYLPDEFHAVYERLSPEALRWELVRG